jgi:ubiquinone/menaquinone biosynthesis C-methylase UbiE
VSEQVTEVAAPPDWEAIEHYYAMFNRTDDLEAAIRQVAGEDLRGRWKSAGTLDFIDNPLVPRAFVHRHAIGAGSRVVDVGAGLGGGSRVYAAAGASVVAVDVLAEQVAAHRRLNAAFGVEGIAVVEGDATQLPFGDEAFTHYASVGALCHVWDRAAAIAEAHRVLEPGGRVAIVDYAAGPEQGPAWIAPGFWHLIPVDQYRDLFSEAGFEDLHFRDVSRDYANQVSIYIRLMERARPLFERRFGGSERYEEALQTYRDFVEGFDRRSAIAGWFEATKPA